METIAWIFLWWISGFIPGIWTASAARRNSNRWMSCPRDLQWNDLWMPFFNGFLGPFGGASAIIAAIVFECGERHWFDFMDRPIFPKKDK